MLTSSFRVNPRFLHMALEGRLSTEGKAKTDLRPRRLTSDSITSLAAAVAIPRPCNSGSTNHPISHPCSPFQSLSQYPTLPAGVLLEPVRIVNIHPVCGFAEMARNSSWRFRILSLLSDPLRCTIRLGSPNVFSKSHMSPSAYGRIETLASSLSLASRGGALSEPIKLNREAIQALH